MWSQLPLEITDRIVVDSPHLRRTCRGLLQAHTRLFDRIVAKHTTWSSICGPEEPDDDQCQYVLRLPNMGSTFTRIFDARCPDFWLFALYKSHLRLEKHDVVNDVKYGVVARCSIKFAEAIAKDNLSTYEAHRASGNLTYHTLLDYLSHVEHVYFTVDKQADAIKYWNGRPAWYLSISYKLTHNKVILTDPEPEILDGRLVAPDEAVSIGGIIDRAKLLEYMCDVAKFDSSSLGFLEQLSKLAAATRS
jgi:hypothetical protein